MKPFGSAVRGALDFVGEDFLPLFIVAVVPEILCVAIVDAGEDVALAGVTHITDLSQATVYLARGAGVVLVAFLAFYGVRAFAWGAMGALFGQRARGEPRSAARALYAAFETYAVTFRTYTALLIPLAVVEGFALGLACLAVVATASGLGLSIAALVALGFMALIPFWLWASGFEYLLAPVLAEGQTSGLEAYRAMRARVRGEWLPVIGIEVCVFLASIVASVAGWLMGLALPSKPENTDWQKLLGPELDWRAVLQQVSLTPDAWDWAHTLVAALPACLAFAFGAALAFSWLTPKET